MTLDDIITRLESATGADRDVDKALFSIMARGLVIDQALVDHPSWTKHVGEHAPNYTASLDAAVALIERVLLLADWGIEYSLNYKAHVTVKIGDDWSVFTAKRPTAALTLCLAFARALRAQREGRER